MMIKLLSGGGSGGKRGYTGTGGGGGGGAYVTLQAATPGVADVGNFNVSGTGIIGTQGAVGGAVEVGYALKVTGAVRVTTVINVNNLVQTSYFSGYNNVLGYYASAFGGIYTTGATGAFPFNFIGNMIISPKTGVANPGNVYIAVGNPTAIMATFSNTGKFGVGTTVPDEIISAETADTSRTSLQINNTSVGGLKWRISSVGSADPRVGNIRIYCVSSSTTCLEAQSSGKVLAMNSLDVGSLLSGGGEAVATKGWITVKVTGVSSSLRLWRTDAGPVYMVFNSEGLDKVWLQQESNYDFTISTGVETLRCKATSGNVGLNSASPGMLVSAAGQRCLTISGVNHAGTGVPLYASSFLELNSTDAGDSQIVGAVAFTQSGLAQTNKCIAIITGESQGAVNSGGIIKFNVKETGGDNFIDAVWIRQTGQVVANYSASIEKGLFVNSNKENYDSYVHGNVHDYMQYWDSSSGFIGFSTTSPAGKLDVFVPKLLTPLSMVFTMEDLAHGITTKLPTNAFGALLCGTPIGLSEGGLLIRGISTNPDVSYVNGVMIEGITSTGEGTPSCVVIRGGHKNGTGTDVVPDSNIILSISNNGTDKIQIFGDGALKIVSPGRLFVDHIYNTTSLHPITFDYNVNLSTVPIYANNAAAITGGLGAGDLYRTNANPDPVCIVH